LSPDGPHCCSNFAITFHLTPSITRLFQFQYLYYHLRPFPGGGEFGNKLAPNSDKFKATLFQALTVDEQLKEDARKKYYRKNLFKNIMESKDHFNNFKRANPSV
jgi:hypothetical protein